MKYMDPTHLCKRCRSGRGAHGTAVATAVVVVAVATDITVPSRVLRGRQSDRHCRCCLRKEVSIKTVGEGHAQGAWHSGRDMDRGTRTHTHTHTGRDRDGNTRTPTDRGRDRDTERENGAAKLRNKCQQNYSKKLDES